MVFSFISCHFGKLSATPSAGVTFFAGLDLLSSTINDLIDFIGLLFHATSANSVQRLPAELLFFVGAKKSNQKKAPCAKKNRCPTLPQVLRSNPLHLRTSPTQAMDFFPAPRTQSYARAVFCAPPTVSSHKLGVYVFSHFIPCHFITMANFLEENRMTVVTFLRNLQNEGCELPAESEECQQSNSHPFKNPYL